MLSKGWREMTPPSAGEVWIGDVGWGDYEEIDRVEDPTQAPADNFGWPCYEGAGRLAAWDQANVGMCESLYAQGAAAVRAPTFAYANQQKIIPGERCNEQAGSALTDLMGELREERYVAMMERIDRNIADLKGEVGRSRPEDHV